MLSGTPAMISLNSFIGFSLHHQVQIKVVHLGDIGDHG